MVTLLDIMNNCNKGSVDIRDGVYCYKMFSLREWLVRMSEGVDPTRDVLIELGFRGTLSNVLLSSETASKVLLTLESILRGITQDLLLDSYYVEIYDILVLGESLVGFRVQFKPVDSEVYTEICLKYIKSSILILECYYNSLPYEVCVSRDSAQILRVLNEDRFVFKAQSVYVDGLRQDFVRNLKAIIRSKRVSRADLKLRLGVSDDELDNFLLGHAQPDTQLLLNFCSYYNLSKTNQIKLGVTPTKVNIDEIVDYLKKWAISLTQRELALLFMDLAVIFVSVGDNLDMELTKLLINYDISVSKLNELKELLTK